MVGIMLHLPQHLSHMLGAQCRVGIAPSTVEVRFQDLHIQAKVFVGARALPSVLNSYRNFFEVRTISITSLHWSQHDQALQSTQNTHLDPLLNRHLWL